MAVPKRKTSKARQRSRSANWKLSAPGLAECPRCHRPKRPHEMCPNCGHYRGREVKEVD
ncbi:MAG: 50S ribosomal protein L32 [Firmicutes bacterium]|nr:50S ribosomal protein L32 [Bacillota bacterium]